MHRAATRARWLVFGMLRVLSRSALALGIATSLLAQRPAPTRPATVQPPVAVPAATDPLHAAGKDVTISLLTMGNGDQIWELVHHVTGYLTRGSTA